MCIGDSFCREIGKFYGIYFLLSGPIPLRCLVDWKRVKGLRDVARLSLSHNELVINSVVRSKYTNHVLCLTVSGLELGLRISVYLIDSICES